LPAGLIYPFFTSAQEVNSGGVAVYVPIVDKKVVEGDIISISSKGYGLTTTAYEANIFGVVVRDPALAFEDGSQAGSYPVVSAGKVLMRVITTNGKIKRGDLLTSSTTPGVGMKAIDSGFIVGSALEDYSSNKPGSILVLLSVGNGNLSTNTSGSILKAFNSVLTSPYLSPFAFIRYLFAGFIVLASFLLAVGYFGRISTLGIEALGRNPLAGKMIIFGVVINILLGIGVILTAIGIAYLVLIL